MIRSKCERLVDGEKCRSRFPVSVRLVKRHGKRVF
jgi:hypothetical protein